VGQLGVARRQHLRVVPLQTLLIGGRARAARSSQNGSQQPVAAGSHWAEAAAVVDVAGAVMPVSD